jgi:hypothetical protein
VNVIARANRSRLVDGRTSYFDEPKEMRATTENTAQVERGRTQVVTAPVIVFLAKLWTG